MDDDDEEDDEGDEEDEDDIDEEEDLDASMVDLDGDDSRYDSSGAGFGQFPVDPRQLPD